MQEEREGENKISKEEESKLSRNREKERVKKGERKRSAPLRWTHLGTEECRGTQRDARRCREVQEVSENSNLLFFLLKS